MTSTNDSPALDREVIESLKELGGEDDPGLFLELVDLFLRETPRLLESLQAAMASGDLTAVERTAHSLKSSCGNIGALVLSELCREVEMCGRGGRSDGLDSLVDRSQREFARVREALQAELP